MSGMEFNPIIDGIALWQYLILLIVAGALWPWRAAGRKP